MGVPAFYRWLSTRYPKIVVNVVEEEATEVDGTEIPVDCTKTNPNGEFDNLYLDMNGIIHPCFHPEDQPAPKTATECFNLIFEYIDRLFIMIRPRKVLYMAIDGVAPRAKMNQQRSRRFRSAKDAEEKAREEEKIRDELRAEGLEVPEKNGEDTILSELSDSNVITPGTPFMAKLSVALQYYVHVRLNTDPAWKGVKVILSDANVPGEGEHKVMNYIREQRGRPGWNPNTVHCIYGLDADLIMLALATHEPHFSILREVVFPTQAQKQHEQDHPTQKKRKKPFQLLKINILREYLAMELQRDDLPFAFDPERVYDDFVFLCFFVGNDFLPHSPTLEIREGGIDLLMKIYKQQLANLGGYLCDGPKVNLQRAEVIMHEVAKCEEAIFKKRMKNLNHQKDRRRFTKRRREDTPPLPAMLSPVGQNSNAQDPKFQPAPLQGPVTILARPRSSLPGQNPEAKGKTNQAAAEVLREQLRGSAPKRIKGDDKKESKGEESAKKSKFRKKNKDKLGKDKAKEEAEEKLEEGTDKKCEGGDVDMDEDGKKGAGNEVNGENMDGIEENAGKSAHEEIWAELSGLGDIGDFQIDADEKRKEEEERKKIEERVKMRLKDLMHEKTDKFDSMVEHEEGIGFGTDGWKQRYYQMKFPDAGHNLPSIIEGMVRSYVEGLCWVMAYYYDGVPSWKWYYPYHYAPFASDLVTISHVQPNFKLGEPFSPLNQLMGVLPAASRHCLPKCMQHLFVSDKSPIREFYPENFKCDMNGKRFAWQAVVLLPFIDEEKLTFATKQCLKDLDDEEIERSKTKLPLLFCHGTYPLASSVHEAAHKFEDLEPEEKMENRMKLDPEETEGMNGYLCLPNGDHCPSVIHAPYNVGEDVKGNQVVCGIYMDPDHERHQSKVLEGTRIETGHVNLGDVPPDAPAWHEGGHNRPYQARTSWVDRAAAGRFIQHNLDSNNRAPPPWRHQQLLTQMQHHQPPPQQPMYHPSPPSQVPPEVTMRAMRMIDQHPQLPQSMQMQQMGRTAPVIPPAYVTDAAIRLHERVGGGQQGPFTQSFPGGFGAPMYGINQGMQPFGGQGMGVNQAMHPQQQFMFNMGGGGGNWQGAGGGMPGQVPLPPNVFANPGAFFQHGSPPARSDRDPRQRRH